MNKYLANPTAIVNNNGYVKGYSNIESTLDNYLNTIGNIVTSHSNKLSELGYGSGSSVDSTAIKEVRDRVYALEQFDATIHTILEGYEETANEAKRTAEIAHNVANEVSEGYDMLNSMASNAESKAVEAKSIASTLSTSVENLKNRVSDLEEMDGQASVPNVGKSTMGYTTDFTEYAGAANKDYQYVEWGDEGRSIGFSDESLLGDVLEEMIYYTCAGITSNHNRIKALEQGGSSSGDSGNCLEQNITFKPYTACSDEALALMGIEEKDKEETVIVRNAIEAGFQAGVGSMFQAKLHDNKIAALENAEYSNHYITYDNDSKLMEFNIAYTNLNQAIENSNESARKIIDAHNDHEARIKAIETVGSESDGTLYTVMKVNAAKNMNNKYEFSSQPEIVESYLMTDILTAIDSNFNTMIEVVGNNLNRLDTLEANSGSGTSCSCPSDVATQLTSHANSISTLDTRSTSQGASITSLETRMIDAETTLNGLKVSNSNCNCDVSSLQERIEQLKTAIVNDLDSIWQELRNNFEELPDKGSTCPEDPWETSSV